MAIDIILSGALPQFQYAKIVHNLLAQHKGLRVIVITLEESYENNPTLKELCVNYNLGLKILLPNIGVQTIVRTDIDPVGQTEQLPSEDGWFPLAILNQCNGLKRLGFHVIIENFIAKVQGIGNDEQKTLKLVCETIDQLLSYHPSFKANFGQFMKLIHFEQILKLADPKSSEHIFHSFRVFLSGCPIINEFYKEFKKAQEKTCIMDKKHLRVEYIWFLTAIFHDIGRPKEGIEKLITTTISNTFEDADYELSIHDSEAKWAESHYIDAKRILGSLGAFVVEGNKKAKWDGGCIQDVDTNKFATPWINLYDNRKSHAVISAFDFLGDIFKKATAANERIHRPFIITHAAPAALSILLHDWRIWNEMKEINLIPVNVPMLPMAALLIYIDTWDNYKRRGPEPLIFIKEYLVNPKGAFVKVEWGDSNLMEEEKIGYIAYKKALINLLFKLEIKYGLAGML